MSDPNRIAHTHQFAHGHQVPAREGLFHPMRRFEASASGVLIAWWEGSGLTLEAVLDEIVGDRESVEIAAAEGVAPPAFGDSIVVTRGGITVAIVLLYGQDGEFYGIIDVPSPGTLRQSS